MDSFRCCFIHSLWTAHAESKGGNERIEWKDGCGKMPEGGWSLAELHLKWSFHWDLDAPSDLPRGGRERRMEGKKRERQSQCSSWTEQMHLEPLNIGHTSLLTVLSNEPASCRIPCIMCAAFHGLLRLSQEKTGIPLTVMCEQSYNHAQGRSQGWNVVKKPSLRCNYFKCSNHSDNCNLENDNVWVV